MMLSKRNILFQGTIFRSYASFWGRTSFWRSSLLESFCCTFVKMIADCISRWKSDGQMPENMKTRHMQTPQNTFKHQKPCLCLLPPQISVLNQASKIRSPNLPPAAAFGYNHDWLSLGGGTDAPWRCWTCIFHCQISLSKKYCWWKKSCTSSYYKNPIIHRVLYIPGGAGFLPSTLVLWLPCDLFADSGA